MRKVAGLTGCTELAKRDQRLVSPASVRPVSIAFCHFIGELSGSVTVLLGLDNVPQEVSNAEWAS